MIGMKSLLSLSLLLCAEAPSEVFESRPRTIFPLPVSVDSPFHPAALRQQFAKASADKAAAEKLYQQLADYKGPDAVVLAYKGAAEAIRARDASMFDKLTYIQQAARSFEQAVSLAPQNAEVRFLRFSVESNLPSFLGMSKHLEEDKALLLRAALEHPASGLDAEAFNFVRRYLVERGHVNEAEARQLNNMAG
jgi:tetratricopeptide (TPR) repeat protein